jgi:signal transduction histidine kinase
MKQLKVEINLDNVPRIHTDKHMINTIISNLVSNAVKYTPKGCSISVGYTENEKNIILSIKDSGIGMSAGEISMILNADSNIPELNLADKNTGGFGLLLSRNFVKRLGGELLIESKPNEGTEVFVSIPKK